jgi:predicted AlkP superfamily phosphohydrolase/phosphomutase
MKRMPADATLIIASDHGSFEHTWGIDMNQLLHRMKLLEYSGPRTIDHDRTLVFHNLWHLYFNHELITREALADRGYDVPAGVDPVEFLASGLRRTTARNEDASRAFIIDAEPVGDGAVGHAPDMVVNSEYHDYMVSFWNIMTPRPEVIRRLEGSEKFWHSRDGVLLVWGEGVREGFDAGKRDIQHVAPTMLYLLGLPGAGDMDGAVMTDLLDRMGPVHVNEGYRDIPREVVQPNTERETLQKTLRSLGYIQ